MGAAVAWMVFRLDLDVDGAIELLRELAQDALAWRRTDPALGDGRPAALEVFASGVRLSEGPGPLRSVVVDGIHRFHKDDERLEFSADGAVCFSVSPFDEPTSDVDADAHDSFAPCLAMLLDRLASVRPELAEQLEGGAADRLLRDDRRMARCPFAMQRLPTVETELAEVRNLLLHLTEWANFEPPVPSDPWASLAALAQCRPRYFQHGAQRMQLSAGSARDRDGGGASIVLRAMLDGGRDAGEAVRFDLYPLGSRTVIEYGAVSTFQPYLAEKLAKIEDAFPEVRRSPYLLPALSNERPVEVREWPEGAGERAKALARMAAMPRNASAEPGDIEQPESTTSDNEPVFGKGGRRPAWPLEEMTLYIAELVAIRRKGGNYRLHCQLNPSPPHPSELPRPSPKTVERWERERREKRAPRRR